MAISIFKSFRSTVNPFWSRDWFSPIKMLVDKDTGAPVGVQSPNGGGPDGIWTPIDLSAAQITNPTAEILADLNATYRLNQAPYSRYYSNGESLVSLGDDNIVEAAGIFDKAASYGLTVTQPEGVIVYGELRVYDYPA